MNRKPIIAVVGRPNVGKSTFVNRLVGRRQSIVDDLPGVTRDRIYFDVEWQHKQFTIIDTGGIVPGDEDEIMLSIYDQAKIACEEADKIIKGEPSFDTTSVFIQNQPDDIDYLDKLAEDSYKSNFSASAHFMQYVLHELFHAVHLDLIFKRDGYNGKSPYGKELYKNPYIKYPKGLYTMDTYSLPIKSDYMQKTIKDSLGKYASTSKAELFAETMTKLFTDSIDSDEMALKNNPLDKLKNYPDFIQKFIKRELD